MSISMMTSSPKSNVRKRRPASMTTQAPTETEADRNNYRNGEVESSLRKQLSLLMLIRCLRTAQLAPPPIVVPYYQNSCHLEASTILWLGSWYSALAAMCEMPSGLVSDVLGRKLTLQLAFLGMGACWIVTYGSSLSSPSTIVYWLGFSQLLRALGSSLYSGTDMAMLYELLKKYKNQQQKNQEKKSISSRKGNVDGDDLALKLESRQVVLSTITEAVVAALGGLLSRSYGESTVIFMSALPPLAGATICFGLEETAMFMDGTVEKEEQKNLPSRVGGDEKSISASQPNSSTSEAIPPKIPPKEKFERRRSSRIVNTLTQPSLCIIFGVGVVLNCGTYVAATALNPLLWQQVGISNFAGGFVQATNSVMTAVGALAAPTLKTTCSGIGHKIIGSNDDGTHGLLLLLLSISTVAYGLMTWNAFSERTPSPESMVPASFFTTSLIQTISTIGASWLLSLVRGLAWPVLGSALNSAIGDNGTRATVLSLFAGAIKIGMVFTGFALGSILHQSSSLGNACALCSCILLAAVAFCLAAFRVRKHEVPPPIAQDGGKKDQ